MKIYLLYVYFVKNAPNPLVFMEIVIMILTKTPKCYLYQVIPIRNSLPKLLKNCTSKFTLKKQIKSHLLAS